MRLQASDAPSLRSLRKKARIVVSGQHDEAGQQLVRNLRVTNTEAEFIRADVRHEVDVRNLVDQTVVRFGQLNVAVNNAGTEGKPGPVTEQSSETYASDKASFSTGSTFAADGGKTARWVFELQFINASKRRTQEVARWHEQVSVTLH